MARRKIDKGVTLIAPHTEVIGDIKFSDQLYVSGKVTGNVLADKEGATVVISEEGCIAGEVRVPNVVMWLRSQGVVKKNVLPRELSRPRSRGASLSSSFVSFVAMMPVTVLKLVSRWLLMRSPSGSLST